MAFRSSMLVLLVAMALCGTCGASADAGATYKVGGPDGWMIREDYDQWSSSKEFHVGDSLLFSYTPYHNVFEVTEQGYKSCDPRSPVAAYSSGSDTITLKRPGHYYFICGIPGHCDAGQKVAVVVRNLPPPADNLILSRIPGSSGLSSPSSTPSPSPFGLSSPSSTPTPTPSAFSTATTPSPAPSALSTATTPSPEPSALSTPSTSSPAPSPSLVYKVGWIIGTDYKRWSSSKEFHVGDTLLFSYNNYHNVIEVTEQGFKSCNSSSPIVAYSSGSDYITLERPGHYYFLCGAPAHCKAGQKVEVVVSPPKANTYVSSQGLSPSGLSTPATPNRAPSPSTTHPQERPPQSAATTINAPKLALASAFFVFVLALF